MIFTKLLLENTLAVRLTTTKLPQNLSCPKLPMSDQFFIVLYRKVRLQFFMRFDTSIYLDPHDPIPHTLSSYAFHRHSLTIPHSLSCASNTIIVFVLRLRLPFNNPLPRVSFPDISTLSKIPSTCILVVTV